MTALTPQQRTLRVVALLFAYPDDALYDQLPMLAAAATACERAAAHLDRFVASLGATASREAQHHYIDTFDLRRRCCPYLTYYAFGDTRKRGMALLRFSHAYRSAGYVADPGELPDHLSVVCEFAAAEPDAGLRLLQEHRAGVELLRLALNDAGSAYVDLVDAVRAVLPAPSERTIERMLELARTGPPAEEVGLDPFMPPEQIGARR